MLLAASSQGGGNFSFLIMMVLLFGAMYFFLIRPQQKRRREVEAMQRSVGVGDRVVTIGGLYGVVLEMDDESVLLEVAPGITNEYVRGAISKVVEPAAEETDVEDTDDADAEVEPVAVEARSGEGRAADRD